MVNTTDGFRIAEVDLQLRGPGDYFGTRQSGVPDFRIANLLTDTKILDAARTDAFDIVAHDPHLRHPEHQAMARHLGARFREALSLLRAG
jgi:ATP-dependent DNA helicase RecG